MNTTSPQILISIAEFLAIKELATRCETLRFSPDEPWPEDEWRMGLERILGDERAIFHNDIYELVVHASDKNPTLFSTEPTRTK